MSFATLGSDSRKVNHARCYLKSVSVQKNEMELFAVEIAICPCGAIKTPNTRKLFVSLHGGRGFEEPHIRVGLPDLEKSCRTYLEKL
jgi:hypothetical protein